MTDRSYLERGDGVEGGPDDVLEVAGGEDVCVRGWGEAGRVGGWGTRGQMRAQHAHTNLLL